MTVSKIVTKLNRIDYVTWDFEFKRFKISIYKMGKKCDLRICIKLGEEW